jgi:hypothetical protein
MSLISSTGTAVVSTRAIRFSLIKQRVQRTFVVFAIVFAVPVSLIMAKKSTSRLAS